MTRVLTAVAVILLCGFAGLHGWEVARFAHARAGLAPGNDRADAVRGWIGVPGVAGAALEAALRQMPEAVDSHAAGRRSDALAALLAERPLSSTLWLALAGARLVSGQPYVTVLLALAMARLTGPNEGRLMLERGIFGFLQWETLPLETRGQVLSDFARAIGGMPVGDLAIAPTKNVIAAKSADDRRDIGDRLRAEGLAPSELARLGL